MSYCPPYYFNPLSQTQPQQQQQQQSYRTPLPTAVQTAVPTAVQTSHVPTSAPWHQQQAVYWPDFATRYVYDSSNPNPNPPTPPTDSLHSPANHQNNQTTGSVMSSLVMTTPVITSPVFTPETPVSKATSPKQEEMIYLAIPHSHINRTEVKTLLAEAAGCTPDKTVKEKSLKQLPALPALSPVKTEPEIQGTEEVVENPSIILDPSVIPEGEGMVDG